MTDSNMSDSLIASPREPTLEETIGDADSVLRHLGYGALADRLASHLASLVRDAQRLDWLLSTPVLTVTLPTLDGSVGADHGICVRFGGRVARLDLDSLITRGEVLGPEELDAALEDRSGATASGEPGRTLSAACPSPIQNHPVREAIDAAEKAGPPPAIDAAQKP